MAKKAAKKSTIQQFTEVMCLKDIKQMQLNVDIKQNKKGKKKPSVFEKRTYESLDLFLQNPSSHMIFVDQQGKIEDIVDYINVWFKKNPETYNSYSDKLADYVYVNNFDEPNCPILLKFPKGRAPAFKSHMEAAVKEIEFLAQGWEQLIQTHEDAQKIMTSLRKKGKAKQRKIKKICKDAGIVIDFDKAFLPGQGTDQAEILCSPAKGYEDVFEDVVNEIYPVLLKEFKMLQDEQLQFVDEARDLRRTIAYEHLDKIFRTMFEKYPSGLVSQYLESCITKISNHLQKGDLIKRQQLMPGLEMPGSNPNDILAALVPVVISTSEKVPVVYEQAMGVGHLIGSEKKIIKYGMLESDLQYLTPGILHKANGGILLINIMDLITYPWTYEVLFKILKSKKVQIESLNSWLGLEHVAGMNPEPFPVDLKVILYFPEMWMYQQLDYQDQEFQEIFSDSYVSISRNRIHLNTGNKKKDKENINYFMHFINNIAGKHNLVLNDKAVLEVMRYVAQLSDSKQIIDINIRIAGKLNKLFSDIAARKVKPTADEIQAITTKFQRGTDAKERNIADGFFDMMLLELKGKEKGVSTGLCVVTYNEDIRVAFPMRITAVTSFGAKGLRFLEDEAGYAHECMKKSFYIISQWLKSTFAQDYPILSEIGVSFEQNYDAMDGDSATIAMTIAIISALAGIKVNRKFAITGSMDQLGNAQPIGALMTKIRGHWLIGKHKNMKEINIVFPEKNLPDLIVSDPQMLNDIQIGRLKLFPVKRIEEALALTLEKDTKEIKKAVQHQLLTYLSVKKQLTEILSSEEEE